MALLQLSNIYKNYSQGGLDVPALSNVNLNIEEGEYVAIMGPSGSGKSTLMNIIGCLDKATKGTYILNNEDINGLNDRKLSDIRNKEIGFVFQQFNLMPRQSALQNVELPLQYAHVPRRDRRPMCEQALIKVGLEDRMNFKATQLSGGQKQRVAIARAIVNKPSILLADEPTGALDSKSGIQVMKLFKQLHDEGSTIIMITHAQEIAEHANRIIKIFDGEITSDKPNTPVVIPVSALETELETRVGEKLEEKLGEKLSDKTVNQDGVTDKVEALAEDKVEEASVQNSVQDTIFKPVNKPVVEEPVIAGPQAMPGFETGSSAQPDAAVAEPVASVTESTAVSGETVNSEAPNPDVTSENNIDSSHKQDIASRINEIRARKAEDDVEEEAEDDIDDIEDDIDELNNSDVIAMSEADTEVLSHEDEVDSGIELYDSSDDIVLENSVNDNKSGGDSL